MKRVCVFDVNETLLDMAALDPLFERAFGDASVRRLWFSQMLQSAFVSNITDAYVTFGEAAGAALRMTEERRGVEVSDEYRREILGGLRTLPPHPEVPESLDRLRDAGFRLATLTNSTQEVAEAQIRERGARGQVRAGPLRRHGETPQARPSPLQNGRTVARDPGPPSCAWLRRMPGTLPGPCARVAPQPSSRGSPSTRSSRSPTWSGLTSPRSPTASSPPIRASRT